METETIANQAEATDLDENMSAPPSPSLHDIGGGSNKNITCRIDGALYFAAVEGNFQEFINIHYLESLLTPNKSTILHIHLHLQQLKVLPKMFRRNTSNNSCFGTICD